MTTSTSRSRRTPLITPPYSLPCCTLLITPVSRSKCTRRPPNPSPSPNPNPSQVHEASTFLVVLTTQYLTSRKCMLGLLTAFRLRKPIVVLREADVRYGGLSAGSFAEEVSLYLARYGNGV